MKIAVKVRRQADRTADPYYQTYSVEADPEKSTVLDLLLRIQWEQDGSLGFRRNCRNVICGSCGMRVNGKAGLACQKHVSEVWDVDAAAALLIEPMGNLPVVKDLIVDMDKFWKNLQRVDPHVAPAARRIDDREFRQTPAQRAQLQAAANCLLCGACYSDCNAASVDEQFVGPHALAKAYRVLADNRDDRQDERLAKYNDTDFAWGCTRCFNCNEVCPVGVQPLDRISQVKQAILSDRSLPETTAQRHRHTMVDLVKAEGWIDESKFGVRVVTDNLKDIKGALGLIPLGLRMMSKGKMPYPWEFQPSPGASAVKSLIEAVQQREDRDVDAAISDIAKTDEPMRGG